MPYSPQLIYLMSQHPLSIVCTSPMPSLHCSYLLDFTTLHDTQQAHPPSPMHRDTLVSSHPHIISPTYPSPSSSSRSPSSDGDGGETSSAGHGSGSASSSRSSSPHLHFPVSSLRRQYASHNLHRQPATLVIP